VEGKDIDLLREIFGAENVVVIDEVIQMEGTVVRLFSDKKFGFIQDANGKDYFFHASDVNGFFDDLVEDLQSGEKIRVTFDVVQSPKGTRAGNVTRVDGGV